MSFPMPTLSKQYISGIVRESAEYLRTELRGKKDGLDIDFKGPNPVVDVFPDRICICGDKTRCYITVVPYPFTERFVNFTVHGAVLDNKENIELRVGNERGGMVQFTNIDEIRHALRLALKFFVAKKAGYVAPESDDDE